MSGNLDIEFHERLKKEIGEEDEDGLLRGFQRELGQGAWTGEGEGKFLVGQCDAIRKVLDIAEGIRLKMMER